MAKQKIADIGLIGGYDLQEILEQKKWLSILTEDHGAPSSKIAVGTLSGKKVAIICRHGLKHTIAPHQINHQANLSALYHLGVRHVICTAAVGAITNIKPGDFALPHDLIDNRGQLTTFFDDENFKHVDMSQPYSEFLRGKIIKAARNLKLKIHTRATYICFLGPRLETPAEIRAAKALGADIVGMTNAPEVILAHELGIEIVTVAIATNWATGVSKKPFTHEDIKKIMCKRASQLTKLIVQTIKIL
jgi:5'-methylthioadenosine phosphorylase